MEFVCRLGAPDGRVLAEVHRARDEVALRTELERRGFHVFELRRRGLALDLGLGGLFRRARRIPATSFLVFNQELAALLKAGLPLLQALDLMLERLRDVHFRSILADVRDRVKAGEDLSDAFAAHADQFPRLYPSTLKAGERTGDLELMVRRFVRYLKLVLEARKRVVSALIYPTVLVGLSFAMLTVMMVYVVPRFTVFFEDLDAELPLLTRMALTVGDFMQDNWPWLAVGLVATALLLRRWGQTPTGREAFDRWKLRVPVLGGVFHRYSLSEFTRSLATLLGGGIPLVGALEISLPGISNAHIRRRLEPTLQEVREGKALHASLEGAGVFDPLEVDMVKVGEATGQLDQMLASVSEFLDDQVETRMQRVLSLIEPLMLVFMGLLIGILLVAIYLPLFNTLGSTQL
jgi:type IV pilus assembly protein PilC